MAMSTRKTASPARAAKSAAAVKTRKPAKAKAKAKVSAGKPATIHEAFARIRSTVRMHDDRYILRFSEAASPGEILSQGDVYLKKLAEIPDGCTEVKSPSLQIAQGNTKGSRHILDSLDGVTVFQLRQANVLQGPILEIEKNRVLTHPEHKHIELTPGIYSVTYQRAKGQSLERVWD